MTWPYANSFFLMPSAPSVIEVTYTGSTMPEAGSAQISIDFGDGTTADEGPHAFTIASPGGSQTISHVYAYDSTFTAQVTVFSDCCSVTKAVTVSPSRMIHNELSSYGLSGLSSSRYDTLSSGCHQRCDGKSTKKESRWAFLQTQEVRGVNVVQIGWLSHKLITRACQWIHIPLSVSIGLKSSSDRQLYAAQCTWH